jgi:hypothetical protein
VLDLLKALENCQRDRIPIALDNIRELEGRVQARTDEGASIESRMNAQILNLKAQNQKLVAGVCVCVCVCVCGGCGSLCVCV